MVCVSVLSLFSLNEVTFRNKKKSFDTGRKIDVSVLSVCVILIILIK